MRIALTGATGFVGSHTAAGLLDAGHEVQLLVRSAERLARTPALRDREPTSVVVGDVADKAAVTEVVYGCDAVVHAAALVRLDARRAAEIREVNVAGTRAVVDAALDAGVSRVLYVSTVSIFGLGDRTVTADSPMATPRGPYATSKLEAERLVRARQREGAPITSVYPSGVHGPDSTGLTESHKATQFWLQYPPRMPGGTSIVDVRDLAAAHRALLEMEDAPPRLMLGGWHLTWDELCDSLRDVTGSLRPRIPMPGPVLRFAGRVGDLSQRVWPRESLWSVESMETATRSPRYDSGPAGALLNGMFRPAAETFADEIHWLAAEGHVPEKLAGRLASAD